MTGSSEGALELRKACPFLPSAVGIDFTAVEWRKRLRLAARRLAVKEVGHGRTWSISGFKILTAYPSLASNHELCGFEEIKDILQQDAMHVLRLCGEANSIISPQGRRSLSRKGRF